METEMHERDSPTATDTAPAPPAEAPRPGRRKLLTHTAMQRHELLRKLVSKIDKTKTIGPAMAPGYRQTKDDEIVAFTFTVGGIDPGNKPQDVAKLLRQLYETLPWPELPVVKVTPPAEQTEQESFAKPRVYRAEFWW
jgi:hypothetical protein